MSEQSAPVQTDAPTTVRGTVERARLALKLVYGLVPIVAGLDKFTTVLVDWSTYLPATVAESLPIGEEPFMYLVGLVEIVAGLVVLSRYTEYGAYLVAAWLVAVAATLALGGYYDIAVRDLAMAVGAVALAQLEAARRES